MKGLIVAVLVALTIIPAGAADCHNTVIDHIGKDADPGTPFFVVVNSGEQFRLYGQDLIDPNSWKAGDEVSICVDPQGPNTFDIKNLRLKNVLVAFKPKI